MRLELVDAVAPPVGGDASHVLVRAGCSVHGYGREEAGLSEVRGGGRGYGGRRFRRGHGARGTDKIEIRNIHVIEVDGSAPALEQPDHPCSIELRIAYFHIPLWRLLRSVFPCLGLELGFIDHEIDVVPDPAWHIAYHHAAEKSLRIGDVAVLDLHDHDGMASALYLHAVPVVLVHHPEQRPALGGEMVHATAVARVQHDLHRHHCVPRRQAIRQGPEGHVDAHRSVDVRLVRTVLDDPASENRLPANIITVIEIVHEQVFRLDRCCRHGRFLRAEGVDVAVDPADVEMPSRHGRRGVDTAILRPHRARSFKPPQHVAGTGVEGVDVRVVRADVYDTVRDRAGREHASPNIGLPDDLAGAGVEGVHVPILRAYEDHVVGDGWRGDDVLAQRAVPDDFARGDVERVDVAVTRAYVDGAGPHRRG